MIRTSLVGLLFLASLAVSPRMALAHCDSVDGPVAQAVAKALDTGNVNLVLPYAPQAAEAELKGAFGQARAVRVLGGEARALADRSFLETAVRLHRAGEGAVFTGVKPAGIDYGPMVPAAERAVATGDLRPVRAVLAETIEHSLGEKLAHVRALQSAPKEPKSEAEVAAARERISAELGFITFAESVRQAVLGNMPLHHED
ncbi:MAG TPA: DUF6448 family protein [Alphaproteobacteria bacterium]|jgi:hypothetical protein|nr:DUF6448 family protein [Alphaproteobacteria bacterium]